MGVIRAFTGALNGTLADQWKDIIQPSPFDEQTVVAPGKHIGTKDGRGVNYKGSEGVISNGSVIYVPENTAAFIFSQQGIETLITESGGFEYKEGQPSVFDGDGIKDAIIDQTIDRFKFGGITSTDKRVAYVNLREIRNIKFGTRGPQVYNDLFYGVDLEIQAYGYFSVKVTDAETFIKNFVPAGVYNYSFNDPSVRTQILGEFLQSFAVALNKLSDNYRISKIQSHGNEIATEIENDGYNAGTWPERFGFKIVKVGIENIEMSEDSKALVKKYASKKMDISAYEGVSQRASDIAAQQKIASGIQEHGFGEGGNMILGMNMAQAMNGNGQMNQGSMAAKKAMSVDEQIEVMKKMKDLLDAGILSQEEFDLKKKEIMGL